MRTPARPQSLRHCDPGRARRFALMLRRRRSPVLLLLDDLLLLLTILQHF
jgi:hypothetical protein